MGSVLERSSPHAANAKNIVTDGAKPYMVSIIFNFLYNIFDLCAIYGQYAIWQTCGRVRPLNSLDIDLCKFHLYSGDL
jgi:hypothetical protein